MNSQLTPLQESIGNEVAYKNSRESGNKKSLQGLQEEAKVILENAVREGNLIDSLYKRYNFLLRIIGLIQRQSADILRPNSEYKETYERASDELDMLVPMLRVLKDY